MATKNVINKPLTPMRPGAEVLEDKRFAREWIQWFRNVSDAIIALQRLSPYVVVRSVTADYTAEPGELVLCDPSSGAFTVTLPATTQGLKARQHMQVEIKHDSDSANNVTVAATDIDGAPTFALKARESITPIRVPGDDRWIIR